MRRKTIVPGKNCGTESGKSFGDISGNFRKITTSLRVRIGHSRLYSSEEVCVMPQVRYGGKTGRVLKLRRSDDIVAVRTRSRRALQEGPVRGPHTAVLNALDLLIDFPDAGVQIFRRRPNAQRE